MRGLEGIQVVEIGQMVGVPWAARIIADLGADVIKLEPPEGDQSRYRGPYSGKFDINKSGLFVVLNFNKRSVSVDLGTKSGMERLHSLLADADLLIHDLAPDLVDSLGLGELSLRSRYPSMVTCSVTPFGRSGPYSGYQAEDLQVMHGGGWGWLTPGGSDRPDLPPLKPHGQQAGFQIGFAAATVALAAVDKAQRTGTGEYIDFAGMSYIASMLEAGFITYTYTGQIPGRIGTRVLNPWKILPTKDGRIFVVCVEDDQWRRLKEIMGHPEWAEMEIFDTQQGRSDAADLLHLWLGEWIAPQKTADLFHLGQANRVAFAPVNTIAQMASDPHLDDREFIVNLDQPGMGVLRIPGPPSKYKNPWWSVRRPAPALGIDQTAGFKTSRPTSQIDSKAVKARPLEGIRVADFSWVWAGPFCGLHLAHLGAEVIKIESAEAPDLGRRLPLHATDCIEGPDTNGYFNQWGQGKKSVRIDLSTEKGRSIAKEIALKCDVVLSNFGTGVMDRFGMGYEDLVADRSDVIVATISGYGQEGPYSKYIGYGPTTAPLSGLSSLTGYEGGDPEEVGVALGDPASGIATAFAIVAALAARRRTGEGQSIDTSLWEATTVCVNEGWMEWLLTGNEPKRIGNRDPVMSPHNIYRCLGEDNWVAIACRTDKDWKKLSEIIDFGKDQNKFATASKRKENEATIDDLINQWTRTQDQWHVTELLQSVGIPAMPSLDAKSLEQNPHLNERGVIERLPHSAVGKKSHVGVPWLFDTATNGVLRSAPLLGEHTTEVLMTVLEMSETDIAALAEEGILK
ncbi:MAG: CaiB/BaiF CoA transferase family protein [Actinomycetota bacterium]|nr:CoA transferase [Acidimicrobiales bacterium]